MTSQPLHIVMLVGSLRVGGAERMMVQTANGLSLHARITFLTLTGGDSLQHELNGNILLKGFGNKKSLPAIPSLIRFLKKEKPDVLISTQIHVNMIAILAKMLSGVKTKIILREATTPGAQFKTFTDVRSRLVNVSAKKLYRKADAIVALCEAVKTNLVDHGFAHPDQVSVIYNPVVNDALQKGLQENVTHPFFNAGVPVYISVGRLARAKNFSLIIRAFSLLIRKKDARLMLIGDGPEKEMLNELVVKLQLRDKIAFTGQVVNPYPYLRQADVYVLSSLFEGLPNALIEAMACGIQLVSVNCPGGSAEVLMNGKVGKLVPENDPEQLANAMLEMIEHPVNKEVLIESARRFNAEQTTAGYLHLLERLLK